MKQFTSFWQEYGSGLLDTLEAFIKAVRTERTVNDAPSSNFERFTGVYKDAPGFLAPERLRMPSLISASSTLEQHNRADWQNVSMDIRHFAAKLVEAFRKQGIPLYVHSAFRTKDEQNALLEAGRSKAQFPRAAHCQGAAVDIVHSKYHWELSPQEWQLIGKIGKQVAAQMGLSLNWGGDWAFYDPAHWELSDWKTNITIPDVGRPVRYTPRAILTGDTSSNASAFFHPVLNRICYPVSVPPSLATVF
jgi:hypothetical protein